MKLFILGATGPTGLQIVRQALAQGHQVTAFVRDPARLPYTDKNLGVATGSLPGDARALEQALRGHDAVISSLGLHNALKAHHFSENNMRMLVPAMQKQGVRRLIIVSANGVGDTRTHSPLLPRLMYRLLLTDIFADKQAGEALVRASSLDWTIAYPTLLTNGPRTGNYRAAERLELKGMPRISRADVADFVLRQLDDRAFLKKGAVISN
jgi:putative NADH-flavin reductase